MPDRLVMSDKEFQEHFEVEITNGPEYDPSAPLVICKCKKCTASWMAPLGEMGELRSGDRNPMLAHAKAHGSKATRLRRLTK